MENEQLPDNLDDVLEQALEALATGVPAAEILAGAGPAAAWLAPMLETSQAVAGLQAAIELPPPAASLERMLAHANTLQATPQPVAASQPWWQSFNMPIFGRGLLFGLKRGFVTATVVAGVLAVFLIGGAFGGSLVLAAENSVPGQWLYPVKRLVERSQLLLTNDPDHNSRLRRSFNQRRQDEVQWLLENDQQEQVTFEGYIVSAGDAVVDFGFLSANLTADSVVGGPLTAGAWVRVEGIVTPAHGLTIVTITETEPVLPLPTATFSVTPSPTPTAVPNTPTATRLPPRESSSDTIIVPPTATASPTATPVQPPQPAVPTATQPAGNDNGNANDAVDGANDNSGSNSGPGGGSDDNTNSNSGPGSGSDDSSGSNSGSGSGDDNSGSNSGSGSGGDDSSGSNSGSGSGGDDDSSGSNSGSGSDDDDDD